ncbi:MAG: competence protein ComEC family protein [Muribaculaceae bacterium]|nr:competence protein ComEC family protein [Muribaculaceae bacterium]
MKAPLSYVPALPAALGMMAGIILFGLSPSWIIPFIALIVALTSFLFHRQWVAFVLVFTTLGWILSFVSRPAPPPEDSFLRKNTWSGVVEDIRATPAAVRLNVKIYDRDSLHITPFHCGVLIPNPPVKFEPGDWINFRGKLSDPAESTDLPDENSYNPKYFTDGITAHANVAPDDIEICGYHQSLRRTATRLQSELRDLIYRSPVNSQTAWFLAATLLGDDSVLAPDVRQQFRTIGAAHYLALSGFHIGIIAMLASIAFFPLKVSRPYGRMRHLFVIVLIWLYAFVCGMSPSLVRAAVLISIFLLAKVFQRQSSPYNSLCVAAILILALSPRQLFAPGFQMSFAAVLAILVFAPRFNPFSNTGSRTYRLASFVTVPLAAMLGTCLITLVHFHRFPLLFLIPNLVLAVLLPLLLSSGVIMIIATAVGLRLSVLGTFTDVIYNSVAGFCQAMSEISGAELTGIFLPTGTVIAAVIALILLAFALNYRKRNYFILAVTALLISWLVFLLQPALPDAELYITRQPLRTDIIIRQGDSAFVVTTAPEQNYTAVAANLSRRYADFLARRSCTDSLTINNLDFSLPTVRRRGDYIIFGNRTLLIASSQTDATIRPNYLLVTRQSGREPFSLVRAVNPDTVIIARDTPQLRASRLLDSCNHHSIPVIYLIDRPFSLTR